MTTTQMGASASPLRFKLDFVILSITDITGTQNAKNIAAPRRGMNPIEGV
jgi:hypothetical protein